MQPRRREYGRCLERSFWATIVRQIESIADSYTGTAKLFSFGLASRTRRAAIRGALSRAPQPRVVLDIGSGPGDSARTIQEEAPGTYTVCVDPSDTLLRTCLGKCDTRLLLEPVQAVAEYLPLRHGAADIVTSFYAIRDYIVLSDGLSEALRVARIVIALGDVFLPDGRLQKIVVKAWVCGVVPLLARLLSPRNGHNYDGICRTLKGWLSLRDLAGLLERLGGRILEAKNHVLGGLGYVVASPSSSSHGRERHTLWLAASGGGEGARTTRGSDLLAGGGRGGKARARHRAVTMASRKSSKGIP